MNQDEVFAQQAINLVKLATMTIEEAYLTVKDIKNRELREQTEKQIDKILNS